MEVFNTYSKMFISTSKDYKLGEPFNIRLTKDEDLRGRRKIDFMLELRYLPYEVGSKAIVNVIDLSGFYISDDSELILNKVIEGEEAKDILFSVAKETIDIAIKDQYDVQLSNLPSFSYSGINLRLNEEKNTLEVVVVKHLHQSQHEFWKRISRRRTITLPDSMKVRLDKVKCMEERRAYPAYDSDLN